MGDLLYLIFESLRGFIAICAAPFSSKHREALANEWNKGLSTQIGLILTVILYTGITGCIFLFIILGITSSK
jgi:hypothetical protein